MTKISNQYSLTNILTADLANSRLGINNVSPTVALDVTGAAKVSTGVRFGSGSTNLNYYEEGTWTPTIVTGGLGLAVVNSAKYTRIGRVVHVIADFSLSGTGNSGNFILGGLPFTNVLDGWTANACYFLGINTDNRNLVAVVTGSAATIQFNINISSTGGSRTAVGTDFGGGYANVNVVYFV
jgi:hypothetical protein